MPHQVLIRLSSLQLLTLQLLKLSSFNLPPSTNPASATLIIILALLPSTLLVLHSSSKMRNHTVRLLGSERRAKIYAVTVHSRVIKTTVTSCVTVASSWIKRHLDATCSRHKRVVGLDIEWRPSFTRGVQNPVAIIQLCIRSCCLIFQLYKASSIPKSLHKALANPYIIYTGVKISADAAKLEEDYGLEVAYHADIAAMAADAFDQKELRRAGLKTLAEMLTGEEMEKPKHVAMSNWEVKELSFAQVGYACADAYYSYKLGKGLICGKWSS